MDGLLIDSEPFWNESSTEIFAKFNMQISPVQYATTTGLRTKEFVHWWFNQFNIPLEHALQAEKDIAQKVIDKVSLHGKLLPGVEYIMDFFRERKFTIGLATSSPLELVDLVVNRFGIKQYLQAITSAENLPLGKPHPQVYLNCAYELKALPTNCICFEDSFNGMIAAKAARMKCVVVPAIQQMNDNKWAAADARIFSLHDFNALLLGEL